MAIMARDSRTEFTPAPEGLHQAVCCDVVDVGMSDTPWGEKHKVDLRWQLDQVNGETKKPFVVMRRYTLSLSQKATLRQHLEAWRGRKFTAEELEGFDLEKLIGANCQVQIVHNLSEDGRTFANIQAIVPIGKGMTKMRVSEDYVRAKNRTDKKGMGENGDPGPGDEDIPF